MRLNSRDVGHYEQAGCYSMCSLCKNCSRICILLSLTALYHWSLSFNAELIRNIILAKWMSVSIQNCKTVTQFDAYPCRSFPHKRTNLFYSFKKLEKFHCNILTCHTLASLPLGKRPSTNGIGGWSNEVGLWNAQKVSEHVVKTVIRNKYNIFRECPCCITFPILHVLYFVIKETLLSELILRLNCVLTRKNVAEFKGLGCLNTTMATTHMS